MIRSAVARRAMLAVFLMVLPFGLASAQTSEPPSAWPSKPVRLIVPIGAGGAVDALSRNIANGMQTLNPGMSVIVENRVGAGGSVAATGVAKEPPDGYTLMMADVGPNAVNHVMTKLTYDPATAFTPIIHIANLSAVVMTRADARYKTLPELIAAAKAQPGKLNYASAGLGNWTQLFMAYLARQAGMEVVNVTFRSGSEMLTAVLRGDADIAVLTLSTGMGQIADGKVRPLAGLSAKPMSALPQVPPVATTIPGFDVNVWHGLVGPAGMDPALVARINGLVNQVLMDPGVRKSIAEAQFAEIVGGTPAEFDAFIKAELKRWPEAVATLGLKAN
jgi:tripartite-type tricarboxylate transporter receptor subunit TctC